jgi:hypothetical protein
MSEIQLSYTTKLEMITDKDDVIAILDHKLEATSPAQTVDYMALAIDHIDAKIADGKSAIKAIQEAIKHEESRKEHIKEQCSNWLEGTGLDKLNGMIVSSVTINKAKPQENIIITDEEALINGGYFKTVVDKTKAKNDLLAGLEVEGAHIEVVHVANKIKVNKKR